MYRSSERTGPSSRPPSSRSPRGQTRRGWASPTTRPAARGSSPPTAGRRWPWGASRCRWRSGGLSSPTPTRY